MNPRSLNRWRTFFSILLIVSFALGNLSIPTGKVYAQDEQTPTVEPSATETSPDEPTLEPTLEEPVVSETPTETIGTETPTVEPTFTQTPTLDVTPTVVPTELGDLTSADTTSDGALDFGPMLTIYYKDLPDVDAALQANSADTQAAIDNATVATAKFQFTFATAGSTSILDSTKTCLATPSAAQQAFIAAGNVWAHIITSSVPIRVYVCWANLSSTSIIGQAASLQAFNTSSQIFYKYAFVDSAIGEDYDPDHYDIYTQYNNYFPFYYGTDGSTPADKVDLLSIVIHELAHGLGFAGSASVDSSNLGYYGTSYSGTYYPSNYDTFVVNSSGTKLTTYTRGSSTLAALLTSNALYFSGTYANMANGGKVKIFAPSTWAQGTSYSHVDQDTFENTVNSVIVPYADYGKAQHNVGPVIKGMMKDLGWTLAIDTPSGIAPSGSISTLLPTFQWSAVGDANSYTLKVYKSSDNSVVLNKALTSSVCVSSTCSYTTTASLSNATSYYFIVTASTPYGNTTTSSSTTFSTAGAATPTKTATSVPPTATPTKTATQVPATATPSIPAATTVVYPVGDINTTSVVLQWKGVAGATSYVFKISNTDAGGTTTVTVQSSCTSGTCTTGTNTIGLTGTHYQITVAAQNSTGISAYSSPVTFKVLPNLLDTPTISAPTGAISYNAPTYAWAASTGATMYSGKVYEGSATTATFSFDTTPASSCSGSSCSYFAMMGLTYNKTYRFTMQATDGSKYSDIATASFTISTPPAVPTLIGPSGEISVDAPTFQWNASTDAVSYNLVVTNTDGSFDVVNTDVNSSACVSNICSAISPVTLVGKNYQFKVSASNGLVSSAFSTPVAFYYTTHIPPAKPAMAGPSGGITADNPTFTWAPVSGASQYSLKVTDTDKSSVALTATVSALACTASLCSYVATTSLLGQNYKSEIYASNYYGKSDYSDPLAFYYTNHIPPAAPTIIGPSGETNSDTPTYQWNAITGATKYHLLVTDLDDDSTVVDTDVATSSCTSTTCSYKPSSVTLLGQNYEFTVRATNYYGDGEYASAVGFNYTYHIAPAIPETTLPTGAITSVTPTFKWNASSTATSYQLVVTLVDSSSTVLDKTIASSACVSGVCSYTSSTSLIGYSYTFKVAAKNTYGQSDFSSERSFWISTHALPMVPTVTGPVDEVSVDQPTYQWNTAEGATSYLLRVTETNTDTVAINGVSVLTSYCSGSTCSYKPTTSLYGQNYKVEVAAKNSVGTSAYSEPVTFYYTNHIPPSAPSMSAPSGKIAIEKPTYKWLPINGATGYKLKVTNVDGETPISVINLDVATSYCTASLCSYTPATTLTGINYQASVAAKNIYGFGDDSAPVVFIIASHTTPEAPVLTSPSGETNTDTPTYQWLPVVGASSYALTVTDVDKSTTPLNNISVAASFCTATLCSYKPGTNLTGQNYQFSVVAKNTFGNATSEVMSFYYTTHVAPTTPETLIAPDGNIYVEQPTYQWNSVSNATSYKVLLTNTDSSTVVFENIISSSVCTSGVCSYKPLTTLTGLNYSFAVKASNVYGDSDYSTPMTFAVASHLPPEAPIVVSPTGNITNERPTYTWNISQGATSYQLKVTRRDDDSVVLDQSVGITACGTSTCSITPLNTLMGHEYEFEVKAINAYGESDYSYALSFTYPSHIPPYAPALLSPEGDLGTKTPVYQWTAVLGATSYLLKVVDTDSETTLISQTVQTTACDASTCSFTPTTRLTGTNYSFTVTAVNSFGQAESSPLTLKVLLPANTTLLAPTSSVEELYPTYKWAVVPAVNSYTLKVINFTTHTVILSKTIPASDCGAETCETSFEKALEYGNYNFEVAATNDFGQGDFVKSEMFGQYLPASPVVIAPADSVYDLKPVVKWKAVKGAISYDLKIINTDTDVVTNFFGLTKACASNSCAYTLTSAMNDGNYRVEVVATNFINEKSEAGTSTFTYLYHTAPAIPVTTSPVGTVYVQKATFQWAPVARATGYIVRILNADDSKLLDASVPSKYCKGTVCSYTTAIVLNDGDFSYQVASVNAFGQSSFSTAVPFSNHYRTAPEAVTLSAPNTTVYVQKPIFQWAASSRASSYRISLVNTDTAATILNDLSISSSYCKAGVCKFTQPSNLADGNYAFRVTAVNAFGSSDASSDMAFTVDYVSAPVAPVLTGPGGTIYTSKPKFTWNASARATGYELHWISVDQPDLSGNIPVTSSICKNNLCAYTSLIALPDGNYQFEVKAKNAFGASDYSDAASFVVDAHALSPVPTTVSPNTTIYASKVPFTWITSDRATSYHLIVTDAGSSQVKFNGFLAASKCKNGSCSLTPTVLFPDGNYQFTVSALNANGESEASTPLSFIVSATTVSAVPELISPMGVTNVSQPAYQWKAAGGATGYSFSIVNSGTSSTVFSTTVKSTVCKNGICSLVPAINLANGNYKFKVAGTNLYGTSAFAEMEFSVFGFNSQFTKDSYGWNPRWTNTWKLSSGSYVANGVGYSDIYSLQSNSFDDVDYSVRVKRSGGMYLKDGFYSAPANSIFVHASLTDNEISGGYEFAYYDLGTKGDSVYAIFKYYPDGTRELIQVAETTSIVAQNWNTLRVTAAEDTYNFYINDHLIYTFTDDSYSRGLMGVSVGQRGNTTATTMYVDWATLSGFSAPEGGFGSVISPEQQALNAMGMDLFGNQFDGSQFQSLNQQ